MKRNKWWEKLIYENPIKNDEHSFLAYIIGSAILVFLILWVLNP